MRECKKKKIGTRINSHEFLNEFLKQLSLESMKTENEKKDQPMQITKLVTNFNNKLRGRTRFENLFSTQLISF